MPAPDLTRNLPFTGPHRTAITLAPAADATVRPITRGPYAPSLRGLNRRMNANRARLVELARRNTRTLTGRDTF